MEILLINQTEVRELLPMDECIAVMEAAFKTLARDDAIVPLRPVMWLPEKFGALGMMPGYLGDINMMGLKVVSVMPGNHGTPYDSHQGIIMNFETKHGRPLCIMDATEITGIRTAATSALATRLLAREDASDLAILGTGVQARAHLQAMRLVRDIRRIRVWSRTPANVRAFAERESAAHGITVEAMDSAQAAVAGADIICTTTAAREPVLLGDWLAPGVHINAVGSSVPFTRELDTAAVVKARLFADRRESTLNEAGDFRMPKAEGALDDDHIRGEIGDVLIGNTAGRQSPVDITLFKSLGIAIEDVAAADYVYNKALERGVGVSVELGGSRYA